MVGSTLFSNGLTNHGLKFTLRSVRTHWLVMLRDALVPPVFADREKDLSGAEVRAEDARRLGSRARRLRVGLMGLGLGTLIAVAGYRWGLSLEDWLDEATRGAWSDVSGYLGDLAGVPFLIAILGAMIALSGADRAATAAWPWLGGGAKVARVLRLGLGVVLGMLTLTACLLAGMVRV